MDNTLGYLHEIFGAGVKLEFHYMSRMKFQVCLPYC